MSKKEQKIKYKVKNWAAYNQSLIERGSLTLWITPEVLDAWRDKRPAQRGGQYEYSNLAIEALLTLKHVLKLPFRATQGFAMSLFSLMGLCQITAPYGVGPAIWQSTPLTVAEQSGTS